MKSLLISIVLSFSLQLMAKTKVIFTEKPDPKKPPVLYIVTDYKKPVKKQITDDVASFASSEDCIAYIDHGANLYIITDFTTLYKNFISDKVSEFQIKDGVVFYTKKIDPNTTSLNVVYELKTFSRSEVLPNYHQYLLDLD